MRREKGFGCLVPKGRGKPFLARWVYRGKVFTKSTGEIDKRKAERVLERLTRPFREEREIDVLRAIEARLKTASETATIPKLPLDGLFEKFRALPQTKDLTESTLGLYENFTNIMLEWMKGKGREFVTDVTEKDAEEYLAFLAEKVTAVTYNIRLVFFKRLWKEFGGELSPFEKFQKRKVPKASSRRALTETEVERVLAEASKDPDDELLFSLGVYTGLRVSDCALMKSEDIDLAANVIRVIPIKTRKHMSSAIEIPMHPALRKTVVAVVKDGGGYLSERNASMYMRGTLAERTKAVMERAGVAARFHSLRHTFVSMSINAGMNPLLVQRIVGHSSVDMTEHYFHANHKAIEDGISKMPDFAA